MNNRSAFKFLVCDIGKKQIITYNPKTKIHQEISTDDFMSLNVSGLFDTSHGGGRSPDTWPKSSEVLMGAKFGYSGGLGPDNMKFVLPQIAYAAGDSDIWVDMEGRIRHNGRLDFDKIQKVLDEVENSGYLKR